MSKIIYVVTSGDYSDYGIDGIFDNKELAQEFIDKFQSRYDKKRIEEMPLNPAEKELREGYDWYMVRMAHDGSCLEVKIHNDSYDVLNPSEHFDARGNLYCTFFAKDEKHAVKITNEKRAQHIANNTWKNLPK